MKKLLFILCTLVLGSFVFAETGFMKTSWYMSLSKLQKVTNAELSTDNYSQIMKEDGLYNLVEKKPITGTLTEISYLLMQHEDGAFYLNAISFLKNKSEIEDLKSKYKQKIYTTSFDFNIDDLVDALGKKDNYQPKDELEKTEICKIIFIPFCFMAEKGGYKALDYINSKEFLDVLEVKLKKGTSQISIYDYNDDTRVYIFENVLKDKAVVVYVPHEQDY